VIRDLRGLKEQLEQLAPRGREGKLVILGPPGRKGKLEQLVQLVLRVQLAYKVFKVQRE
jgi:hypothetical protein